jgi:hypothetical protein
MLSNKACHPHYLSNAALLNVSGKVHRARHLPAHGVTHAFLKKAVRISRARPAAPRPARISDLTLLMNRSTRARLLWSAACLILAISIFLQRRVLAVFEIGQLVVQISASATPICFRSFVVVFPWKRTG